jgi:hypothetical protein
LDGNHNDNRRASIVLEHAPAEQAGLVVDDGGERGSGLVLDDGDDERGSDLVVDGGVGDGPASGLVIDDGGRSGGATARPASSPSRFGDPMPLSAADAQRIAAGKLETSKILGLLERELLEQLTDEETRQQVARFLKKLSALELQFGDLQKARNNFVGYRNWLGELTPLKDAPDAARRLCALVAAEERRSALDELELHVRVALDDKVLEWAEHQKVLRKAAQLGLAADDVEAIYRKFEPFEREPQAAAERAAATGWTPHPKLTVAGEVFAWNLKRLRDAMLERFDAAIEIANQPFDKTYSLYDYLDRNREDARKELALRARQAAEEAQNPALAVWYFLWTTGPAVLHLGSKTSRTVKRRQRQLESVNELTALAATEWIVDDLALVLVSGLLENWLFVVTKDERLFRLAAGLRQEARGVPNSERADFGRRAAICILWQLGFRGLPLQDSAKRGIVVEDLAQLVARAEECWDCLEWALRSGVLAEWLDLVDPRQAARAREAMVR